MELVYWIVGGFAVFAVAAVAVGRVTANLSRDSQRIIFDVEQSVEFVAEALPGSVTAELSYDEVTTILRLFHDYLHGEGVATTAGEDEAGRIQLVDPSQGVDYVLRRAALADISYRRSDVEAVIDAQMAYFTAIGVVGEPVEPTDPGRDDPDLNGSDGGAR